MIRSSLLRRSLAIGCIVIILVTTCIVFAFRASSSNNTDFVTRSGAQLQLHGKPFRFAGANIYWAGLDENVGGVNYPTSFRVDDAFLTVEEMGATVVRAHTLGISVGCQLCVEPSLGKFNETALEHIDYALKSARDHHIRLVIPLVDNWHYYHGGKHTFTDWRGIHDEFKFFTNQTVIHDFEQYISTLLNHVNHYTGIAYKDDPTIMAWETGNELGAPITWTKTISAFIKNIDKHHLIIDGTSFVNTDALSLPDVDIFTIHYYPARVAQMQQDAATITAANKVFYVGEYAWQYGDPLQSFLAAIEKSGAAGDTYWDFFPHNDTYGYVQHSDNYTLHYPGDNDAMRSAVELFRAHAYRMQGQAVPPISKPGAPLITSIRGKAIAWRGSAMGDTYSIERSTAGKNGPWTLVCNRCATDNSTPWIDAKQPSAMLWYRVQASNVMNIAGPYSAVYQFAH
jgi:mannan endo-1,4-beta-mannosidase